MNIWDHSSISVRKFGGKEEDYYEIHKFIDSSKLFLYNPRHRLLLHNLYGIEISILKFGDFIKNSEEKIILVRDIVAEHCKEDLSGKVPSLNEWLSINDQAISSQIVIPIIKDPELKAFVYKPLLKSNLKSSLLITLSNFGVFLTENILGLEKALILNSLINENATIQNYLKEFVFHEKWQFTPSREEIEWLKNFKQKISKHEGTE
jgi:hypothetical protein